MFEIGSILHSSLQAWSGKDSVGEIIEIREDGIAKSFRITSIYQMSCLPGDNIHYTKQRLMIQFEEVQ